VHPNAIRVFFFTNLMHKFFILIHLFYSSKCFEHYCAHLQEENFINTASDIVTLFGWLFSTQVTRVSPFVTCVLNSHPTRVTIPDVVLIHLSSWRWEKQCSKHVEKCNVYWNKEFVQQVGKKKLLLMFVLITHVNKATCCKLSWSSSGHIVW